MHWQESAAEELLNQPEDPARQFASCANAPRLSGDIEKKNNQQADDKQQNHGRTEIGELDVYQII